MRMATRRRVRFSKHAIDLRMPQRGISVADVFAALAFPAYALPGNRNGTLESYGITADGRPFYVVTKHGRTLVITVIDF